MHLPSQRYHPLGIDVTNLKVPCGLKDMGAVIQSVAFEFHNGRFLRSSS